MAEDLTTVYNDVPIRNSRLAQKQIVFRVCHQMIFEAELGKYNHNIHALLEKLMQYLMGH